MTRSGLTPKREKFAQAIASGKSQAEAYRIAFSADKMSPPAIYVEAGRLVEDPKVSLRIAELRAPAVEKAGITLEGHLADLKSLRNLAAKAEQYAAAITAEVARAKHAGIAAPEKRELAGPNGMPIQVAAVSPDEYRRIAAEIAART